MHPSTLLIAAAAFGSVLCLATPALAGAPLLCTEFEIGGARSIPYSNDGEAARRVDKSRLVAEVAGVLKTEHDVIVRMETLRRAVLTIGKDRELAWELVGRSGLMVLEQQAARSTDVMALFDTGFLLASFEQLGVDLAFNAGVADGMRGYGYVQRAVDAARAQKHEGLAAMEFAAALITHPCMQRDPKTADAVLRREEIYAGHVRRAAAAVEEGSLAAKNLARHLADWGKPKRA